MRITIALISLFLLLACGGKKKISTESQQPAKPPALSIDTYVVQSQSISDNVQVPGTILPYESTEIHPEVSGRLVVLNIKEGGFVNKGALLAKIYDGDLQAQLNKLRTQLAIAQQSENRSSQLLKIQGISQQDYDMSLLQVNNIKADIQIIQAGISKTAIYAPFSGKLGLKNISPGAFITPATVITTIGQVSQLKLQFTIPEKYGAEIKNGQDIEFMIDGSPVKYQADVSATEVAIEEATRSLSVRAIVKGKNPMLVPGAFAKVVISMGKNENALMIPSGAIVPQGRKKLIYLYKAGKAIPAEVTTGFRDSSHVQVVNGLNTGDTVITSGLLFLKPGTDVRLTAAKK